MTLCGVLKDVMLVAASMLIWGTPISRLQFFGYGIALCGMVYYKLGYEAIKGYAGEGVRQWAEFGAARPVLRKLIVIVSGLFFIFVLFGGLAPSYAPDYDPSAYLSEAASKYGWSS
jgi:hypothetical protein